MTLQDQIAALPDVEFHELRQWMVDQARLREARPLVVAREDEIAREFHAANPTAADPDTGHLVWFQPTGAHDAWPIDATVTHNGRVWVNISGVPNVWEPGADGPVPTWRERDVDDAPAPEYPGDDDEPDGSAPEEPQTPAWEPGVDYKIGNVVDYQGVEYRVIQDHTSAGHWTPDAVASLYTRM